MAKVRVTPYYTGTPIVEEEAEEFFSHCVGKGWQKLLLELTDHLVFLGWDGGLNQVKEKFGTLRFYWRNNIKCKVKHEIADHLVELAEHTSGYVCEDCGGHGRLHGDGWLRTLCDKCYHPKEIE